MTRTGFFKSFSYASKGFFKIISTERNIKIQTIVGAFVIFLAILLEISKSYLITIIVVSFLVIILEMFNNNFEKLVDLVSPEYNKKAGEIKDSMAGIVLMASLLAIIVGLLILYKPIEHAVRFLPSSFIPIVFILTNILLFIIIILYKRKISS